MDAKARFLRRYTDIPALLAILKNKRLTLLPTTSWDDRNDRIVMDAYARAKKLKTLLALCFSEATETYHHWKVFAPGNSGVCVEFHRDTLLKALNGTGIKHAGITYQRIVDLKDGRHGVNILPFTKRAAFADEKEYRLIFQSETEHLESRAVPVRLSVVHRVAINPWIPEPLFEVIRDTIRSIDGCENVAVYQSKLIESPSWRRFADQFA